MFNVSQKKGWAFTIRIVSFLVLTPQRCSIGLGNAISLYNYEAVFSIMAHTWWWGSQIAVKKIYKKLLCNLVVVLHIWSITLRNTHEGVYCNSGETYHLNICIMSHMLHISSRLRLLLQYR